ncbi:hypothetical protein N9L06_02660 [Mariniblastus sp.]|nr:hypothetical protein [Mariniblastus sp.]
MKTNTQDESVTRRDHSRFRFSIRSLLLLFFVVAILIVAVQLVRARRTVYTSLYPTEINVQIFEPHIESIVTGNRSIEKLVINPSFNSIIIAGQARNIDAATKAVERLIEEPHLMLPESSLDATIHEAPN